MIVSDQAAALIGYAISIVPQMTKTKIVSPTLLKPLVRKLSGLVVGGSLLGQCWLPQSVNAQMGTYCQLSPEDVSAQEKLLQASASSLDAKAQYQNLVEERAEWLSECRSQNWPQNQAIWLRLYPCDVNPGALERILDRIVSRGYNQVYLEVFADGQVLLPPADNPTPWLSVARSPGAENVDLLAQTIQKGHERGLKVYAWMFSLNFGYSYAQRSDRQSVLARNGQGENSINVVDDQSQAFVDPYNRQAQSDYHALLKAVQQRRPDGVLFDYIRYPRGMGSQSVASQVKDLWIYGDASRQALYNRAQNKKGRALIERYVTHGDISYSDVVAVDKLYPDEGAPWWEGRAPFPKGVKISPQARYQQLRLDLWYLSVAHAAQGVLDFLAMAAYPFEQEGIPVGAVFFPGGNQAVGRQGFDSRLQPWNNFPASFEWHPMSYGICGDTTCIIDQVKQVLDTASSQTQIIPALAGVWEQPYKDRPALEAQMQSLYRAAPHIQTVSHFAYSWQDPELERDRRSCSNEWPVTEKID